MLMAVLRIITLTGMLALVSTYILLNGAKLELLGIAREMLLEGPMTMPLSIRMGKDVVYDGSLASSDIHDYRGQKQINFQQLPGQLLDIAKTTGKRLIVSMDDQSAPALPTGNQGILSAVFPDRIIMLYALADATALMNSIHAERLKGRNIMECLDQNACSSIKLRSDQWSRLTGPFLESDISEDRRGMPKGRWLFGPETEIELVSQSAQRVQMLVYLMSTIPKQQIQFKSDAIVHTEEFELPDTTNVAGRLLLFPHVFMLDLALEPGVNPVKMVFSGALLPTAKRPAQLAAYITRVRLKTVENQ